MFSNSPVHKHIYLCVYIVSIYQVCIYIPYLGIQYLTGNNDSLRRPLIVQTRHNCTLKYTYIYFLDYLNGNQESHYQ